MKEFRVACLCAAWCDSCRDYRATFDALAARLAGDAEFAWIDIEDQADALGDLQVENFPTLLVARGEHALFFGPVTPQPQTAERLVQSALEGALAAPPGTIPDDLPQRVRRAAVPGR